MDSSKTAVITGAGTGIGHATALALYRAGYHVVLAGRRADRLESVARACSGGTTRTLVVPTDVADPQSVEALFTKAQETFGRIDLLFNNAGMNASPTPLEELSFEQWQKVVDVNLTGVFLCTQAAFRRMKSQSPRGGRIINNGSISSQVPRPHAIAYTATKCGVTGLTKTTALEGRAYNIACGQIDVGNAETELAARIRDGALQPDGQIKAEPMMHVDNVANAVVHMASLPLDANILFLTVMATNMPLVGRG